MRQTGKCPKCGSQNIQQNARMSTDKTYSLNVEAAVYKDPEALVFKGETARYTLGAWICLACGFTELYSL